MHRRERRVLNPVQIFPVVGSWVQTKLDKDKLSTIVAPKVVVSEFSFSPE